MRIKNYSAAMLLCLAMTTHISLASTADEDVSHALRVLKGMDYDITQEQAVAIIKNAAESGDDARAMNALGLFQMNGMYVEKDTTEGVRWLETAGLNGYAEAYHNLGVAYKLARHNMAQDFCKAFGYYKAGADSGSVNCMYDAGYMLYKGLGCKQDYEKAVGLFRTAADYKHPAAMYMLGLSYRNGYGVERDDNLASLYLERAATLGSRFAMEELMRPEPENCFEDIFTVNNMGYTIPETMPQVAPQVNDTSIIWGDYTGYIVMYDWSGQHVIGEKPVAASIKRSGESVYGELVLGTDTIPYCAELTTDGRMIFSNVTTSLGERYTPGKPVPYRLDNVQLDIWNESLRGDMSLYNLKEKEPERPMYMELQRIGSENKQNTLYCHVTASPNPFSASFEAIFELKGNAEANVRVFNQLGVMVWNENLGLLEDGKHSVSITPNIPDGTYVLNIAAGRQVFRTIIVKKGGVR